MFRARAGLAKLLQAQAVAVSVSHRHPEAISCLSCLALSASAAQPLCTFALRNPGEARHQASTDSSLGGQQRRQLFSFPGGNSAKPKEYHERKLLQYVPS